MTAQLRTAPAGELDTLVSVLDLVRSGAACTRPDLVRRSGLGRTVVTQRVQQLLDARLLVEGALGPSSGGRAPRELAFHADAGHLLVAGGPSGVDRPRGATAPDDEVFAHVHAAVGMPATGAGAVATRSEGPDLPFAYTFPTPGSYRVWVQFLHERTVRTVYATIDVTSARGAS